MERGGLREIRERERADQFFLARLEREERKYSPPKQQILTSCEVKLVLIASIDRRYIPPCDEILFLSSGNYLISISASRNRADLRIIIPKENQTFADRKSESQFSSQSQHFKYMNFQNFP